MNNLTENKPKCLISLNGTTILQTISIAFPKPIVIIIGDYKIDVIDRYLELVEPEFEYHVVKANGIGTNAGIREALSYIPNTESFAISWSDLFYRTPVSIPTRAVNYVGVTNSNMCRYSFENGKFIEGNTLKNGVIGLFLFRNKEVLLDAPDNGEFVKYLDNADIKFEPLTLDSVYEIGTMDSYLKFKSQFPVSRYFNDVHIGEKVVIKNARDPKFVSLLEDEINWYRYMGSKGFAAIPKINNYKPLTLERINGMHPHKIMNLSHNEKIGLITKIIQKLDEMHSLERQSVNREDLYKVYVNKTLERIKPVSKMLNLHSGKKYVVNGKKVEVLTPSESAVIKGMFNELSYVHYFSPIHGDPTFSNILVTKGKEIKFIDPRGYFGDSKIYGDPRYDFAKLYYSAVGNYDQFNEQNFKFKLQFDEVTIRISSSTYENVLPDLDFYSVNIKDIEILHSLIWLSLSGYLINDLDSMMASYFHGLELVAEVTEKYGI